MQRTMRADNGDHHRSMAMAHGVHGVHSSGAGAGAKTVYGDGSWQLTIFVTDLQVERSLRVRGDLHIGGVMIKLVDSLGMFYQNQSNPFIINHLINLTS